MSHFPDMGTRAMVASGPYVRAVGWLHPDHSYSRGPVAAPFLERLRVFAKAGWRCCDTLGFVSYRGIHNCEFCDGAIGHGNIGIPCDDLLFVMPEMIVHYIERHDYQPPDEFVEAVMRCPLPDTEEFATYCEPFFHLQQER